jgi:hypothetical protein
MSQPLSIVGSNPPDAGGDRGDHGAEHVDPEAGPAVSPRKQLTDEIERDDAKQVLGVLLAAVQRERARADQFYVRARNLLAYGTALFVGIQAAFLANLGRETVSGKLLITGVERGNVATAAAVGLGALALATVVLFMFADRARRVDTTQGDDLLEAWLDPYGKYSRSSVLETLVAKVAREEEAWASANRRRGKLNSGLALLAGTAAIAALVELVILYTALA